MQLLLTVIVASLVFMFPQIMALILYFYDITKFAIVKTKTVLRKIGIGVCCNDTMDVTEVQNKESADDYTSDTELVDEDRFNVDAYDSDASTYEDSLSSQENDDSPSESDLSETRSCGSRYSTDSSTKPCFSPVATSGPVHSGFMLHYDDDDKCEIEMVAT